MDLKDFLVKDLVFLDQTFENYEQVFNFVGDQALNLGLVEASFGQSLIDREDEFPTGLKVGEMAISISHTDPEHIKKEFISIVRPSQAVTFQAIDQPEEALDVQLIFVLGLQKAVNQLEALKAIMVLLEDTDKLQAFLTSQDLISLI